jgi:hypothetical protein
MWRRGTKARGLLYGLWRLGEISAAGWVLLVEGESDCHTAWLHGLPALGVPGANNWAASAAGPLAGLNVYVWQEPDQGGQTFIEKVAKSLPSAQVIGGKYKDLSDAHAAGENIPDLVAQIKGAARPIAKVATAPNRASLLADLSERLGFPVLGLTQYRSQPERLVLHTGFGDCELGDMANLLSLHHFRARVAVATKRYVNVPRAQWPEVAQSLLNVVEDVAVEGGSPVEIVQEWLRTLLDYDGMDDWSDERFCGGRPFTKDGQIHFSLGQLMGIPTWSHSPDRMTTPRVCALLKQIGASEVQLRRGEKRMRVWRLPSGYEV